MLIDLSCPVENRGISVRTNSETGESYLLLKLLNISEKTITSLNFNVKVFNENGTELACIPVELAELSALSKEYFAENKAISLADVPDAKNFIIEIESAVFEDGEIYEPSEENTIECDDSEASLNDALALRELAPEAICFSSEHENYWRCVCGRHNFKDSEKCVRCARDKEAVLANFSSKAALENAILAIKEEEAQKALEEELAKEAKKKENIKKFKIAGIALAALLVLFVIGYFVRYGIVSIMAGNAAKDGNYVKAYELYSSVNNPKRATITDKAIGNNPLNLMFGAGFLAEDEENLYYITRNSYAQSANLVRENKETKEKWILTDAAYGSLNVAGDYIYFTDTEGKPSKMSKDGKSIETLLDVQTYYVCVLGNDMYYIKTDYDNPKGFTEEECQILASQGQMESYTRLHRFDLDKKKDYLVSEEPVYMCSIFGNRIYYLTPTNEEDTWSMSNLKSMNLSGKDIKTHVDMPTNSFYIKDDVIYYISCFYEDLKGSEISDMSSIDYSLMSLNLKTGEKAKISDDADIIMDMNVSGDSLVLVTYNRDQFISFYSGTSEEATSPVSEFKLYDMKEGKIKSLIAHDAVATNVCGDEVFTISVGGNLTRFTLTNPTIEQLDENGKAIAPEEIELETDIVIE